jgi:hypothetical protein
MVHFASPHFVRGDTKDVGPQMSARPNAYKVIFYPTSYGLFKEKISTRL